MRRTGPEQPPPIAPTSTGSRTAHGIAPFGDLEGIYRAAPVGLGVLDRSLRYVWINDWLAEINGATVEAHLGRTVREMVPALTGQVEALVRRIVETGVPVRNVELTGETPAQPGVSRTWLEQWHPMRDEAGDIVGVSIVVEDITERRRVENENARLLDQVRSESERLRSVFAQAPGFICILQGPEHRFEFVNDAHVRLFGDRGLVGKTVREGFPELESQGFYELLDHVHGAGERFVATAMPALLRVGEEGRLSERFLDFVYEPMRDARGAVIGVFCEGYDVTDRVRAERRLRESEERLRRALSIETVGVLDFRLDGAILDANAALQRMTGYSVDEFRAITDWAVLTPPEFLDVTRRAAAELAANGRTAPYEKQWIRKDGSRMWGLFAPTRVAGIGIEAECIGFIIDMTDAKAAEAALHDADRAKDEFLAMLSHELRNPLAPIRTGLRLLERTQPLTERGRDMLAMIERQAQQMQRLIDDLMEVSRITRGRIELHPEIVSVGTLIHNATDAVAHECEARRHDLRVLLPPEPIRIVADPVRLAQVLENLLQNACKYTPDGGEIRIEGRSGAEAVEIRVVDNGMGIEPDKQASLFTLFHQIDTTLDRSRGGLGIGLALVRRLVELHGGDVSVASEGRGRGSTFTVRLPKGRPEVG